VRARADDGHNLILNRCSGEGLGLFRAMSQGNDEGHFTPLLKPRHQRFAADLKASFGLHEFTDFVVGIGERDFRPIWFSAEKRFGKFHRL